MGEGGVFMKIKFDFKELDKKLESLSGNVPLDELLNSNFMRKYTQFQTAQEFADTSSFDFSNIESINSNDLDKFVSAHTKFSSWQEMLNHAGAEWIQNQF